MDEELDDIFDTSLSLEETGSPLNDSLSQLSNTNSKKSQIPKAPIRKPNKIVDFSTKFNDLKRDIDQKVDSLKQRHLTKEQTITASNDLKYRNLIWEITSNNFGHGSYTEDLAPLFQKQLADEEFKLKREIINLQEQQREELSLAKENADLEDRHQRNTAHRSINPEAIAQTIFKFLSLDLDEMDEKAIDSTIDDIVQKIKKEKDIVTSPKYKTPTRRNKYDELSPIPKSHKTPHSGRGIKEHHRSPHIKSPNSYEDRNIFSPKPVKSPGSSNAQNSANPQIAADIRRHIRERTKLQEQIKKTDRMLRKMKQDAYNDVFYPNLSPRKY